jgi:phospholipase/carboxylesterase
MPRTHLILPPECLVEGFHTAELESFDGLPVRTFLPKDYEPNYPYPLLVFFHGQGGNEEQILRLAPDVSRRNYVCISLRGPQPLGPGLEGEPGFGWGPDEPCSNSIEDYVLRAIEQTRRRYHIHSERIYLAGICEGATLAYRLALTYPERFGGLISLNGAMPRRNCPLFRLPELRQLRVLIGHGIANAFVPMSMARRDFKLLFTAGVDIRIRTYPTTHRVHADMLRDVDRWIQQVIESELEF